MIITTTLANSFMMKASKWNTSTVRYMNAVSKPRDRRRPAINVQNSYETYFSPHCLLRKTKILFTKKAKMTATTQAITLDTVVEIWRT